MRNRGIELLGNRRPAQIHDNKSLPEQALGEGGNKTDLDEPCAAFSAALVTSRCVIMKPDGELQRRGQDKIGVGIS